MKQATGMMPVAIGVAMALLSGMATAEEKIQAQSAGATVTAETTLPSVGYRIHFDLNNEIVAKLSGETYTPDDPDGWIVGDHFVASPTGHTRDPDTANGGSIEEFSTQVSCKKYRIAPDGSEEFLGEFSDCLVEPVSTPIGSVDSGASYIPAKEDIGYRFKFVAWKEIDPSTTPGYTANPARTEEVTVVTPPVTPVPAIKHVEVNGHKFGVSEGFPSTGFKGAYFYIVPPSGSPDDYIWEDLTNTVALNRNRIEFTNPPTKPIIVSARPVRGGGDPVSITIMPPKYWFTGSGTQKMDWSAASRSCSGRRTQPVNGNMTKGIGVRKVGSLFSEWGTMDAYRSSDFTSSGHYWTSDENAGGAWHGSVNLGDGGVLWTYNNDLQSAVCLENL